MREVFVQQSETFILRASGNRRENDENLFRYSMLPPSMYRLGASLVDTCPRGFVFSSGNDVLDLASSWPLPQVARPQQGVHLFVSYSVFHTLGFILCCHHLAFAEIEPASQLGSRCSESPLFLHQGEVVKTLLVKKCPLLNLWDYNLLRSLLSLNPVFPRLHP